MPYIAKTDDDLMMVGYVNDDKNVDDDDVVSRDEMIQILAEMLKGSDIGYFFKD